MGAPRDAAPHLRLSRRAGRGADRPPHAAGGKGAGRRAEVRGVAARLRILSEPAARARGMDRRGARGAVQRHCAGRAGGGGELRHPPRPRRVQGAPDGDADARGLAAAVDRDLQQGAARLPLGIVRRRRRDAVFERADSEGGYSHRGAALRAGITMRAAIVRRKFAAMSGERILEVLASPRRRYRSEAIEIAVAELDSRGKHLLLESPPFRPFTAFPFICPNCENVFEEPKVFCSEQCQQVAIFVRDHRRYIDDGRFEQPDFQQLFYDRFVLLMSGYSPSARRVPKRIRAAAIARDGGRCRKCGAPTNIIDHIQGNSQELSNLQVLCDACNWAKARERYVPIPRESLAKET